MDFSPVLGPAAAPEIAAAIRETIVRGDFVPNQRLVETDLADRFGASRGAIRLALLDLVNEGLVERVPNRGARVRSVSLAEALEICDVRLMLEPLCASLAATRADAAARRELAELGESLTAAFAAGDVLGQSDLNHALHRRIRDLSAHHTATRILERLRAQAALHRFRLTSLPGRARASLAEHLALLTAVGDGDPNRAAEAARVHLEAVVAALRESG